MKHLDEIDQALSTEIAACESRLRMLEMDRQEALTAVVFADHEFQPFGDRGNVYETLEVRDAWGKLVVTQGGALISSDYQRLFVPANGDGYALTLNEGWKMVAGGREGDKTLSR